MIFWWHKRKEWLAKRMVILSRSCANLSRMDEFNRKKYEFTGIIRCDMKQKLYKLDEKLYICPVVQTNQKIVNDINNV